MSDAKNAPKKLRPMEDHPAFGNACLRLAHQLETTSAGATPAGLEFLKHWREMHPELLDHEGKVRFDIPAQPVCTHRQKTPPHQHVPGEHRASNAPEHARVERRPEAPGPGHVWQEGHWTPAGQWIAGRWTEAPPAAAGVVWSSGRWEQDGADWLHYPGQWIAAPPPEPKAAAPAQPPK